MDSGDLAVHTALEGDGVVSRHGAKRCEINWNRTQANGVYSHRNGTICLRGAFGSLLSLCSLIIPDAPDDEGDRAQDDQGDDDDADPSSAPGLMLGTVLSRHSLRRGGCVGRQLVRGIKKWNSVQTGRCFGLAGRLHAVFWDHPCRVGGRGVVSSDCLTINEVDA